MSDLLTHSESPLQPDPLDALLANARWPEPTPESAERLLEAWSACSPMNRRKNHWRFLPMAVGVAAAILLLASGARLLLRHPGGEISVDLPAVQIPEFPGSASMRPGDQRPAPRVVSRLATPYERWSLLYLPAESKSPSLPAGANAVSPDPLRRFVPPDGLPGVEGKAREMVLGLSRVTSPVARQRTIGGWLADGSQVPLDAAISALADPNLRQDAWAAAQAAPAPAPDLLLAHFVDRHANYRFAAARMLGYRCNPALRNILERMVRQGEHQREALAALLCCPDAEASQFLHQLQSDRLLDAQIRSARQQLERLCS